MTLSANQGEVCYSDLELEIMGNSFLHGKMGFYLQLKLIYLR